MHEPEVMITSNDGDVVVRRRSEAIHECYQCARYCFYEFTNLDVHEGFFCTVRCRDRWIRLNGEK